MPRVKIDTPRDEHHARQLEWQRAWLADHPDYHREWVARNAEKVAAYRAADQAKRIRVPKRTDGACLECGISLAGRHRTAVYCSQQCGDRRRERMRYHTDSAYRANDLATSALRQGFRRALGL